MNAPSNPPPLADNSLLAVKDLSKSFTLHAQGGRHLPVLQALCLTVEKGECLALDGPSGSGKSTLLRSLYGNYRVEAGEIWVKHQEQWVDLVRCAPHELIDLRRHTLGYVSQFLRVIPRVSALDVAAEPLIEIGVDPLEAAEKVRSLFRALNLPEPLWSLSPTTFSGGEKQRVNIARAFGVQRPLLLLDEPTAALDADNRAAVVALIEKKKAEGCAVIGIFHDEAVKLQVCNRALTFDLQD